ncbi:MAG: hypothetical protein KAG66_06455, partial [Methylococcales bacterium]|nr:hypothetical protein [Methylococcales bacterium]
MSNLSAISDDNWNTARTLLAAGLVVGSIYLSVLAAMWFVGDFVAMAANSPNLDEATQVADFNNLSYISEALRGYRVNLGIIVLTMAIAMAMQAVLFLQPRSISVALFIVGGVAMILQATLLFTTFYWPVFLFFILTTLGLYLTIELGDRDIPHDEPEEFEPKAQLDPELNMGSEPRKEPVIRKEPAARKEPVVRKEPEVKKAPEAKRAP